MTSKEALNIIKSNKGKAFCEAYEELLNVIEHDLNRLEKVEKDLKQTKLNFKNSQTHSRNCYKKLLDRYMGLEKENEKLKEKYKHRAETSNDLCNAVKQYEKAIEILKDKDVEMNWLMTDSLELYNAGLCKKYQLTQEEYELLKEVL